MPSPAHVKDELRVEVLTLGLLHREIEAILGVDADTSSEMLEPWSRENFLFELPGKWEYSMLARDGAGIAGFEILSVKKDALHFHRIVVRRHLRRHRVGTVLLSTVARLGLDNGFRHMTAKVAGHNRKGLDAQLRLGARVDGQEGPNVLIVHDLATLAARLGGERS
jgi:ribosomal protein S18 acetylase RimI-like enzyme